MAPPPSALGGDPDGGSAQNKAKRLAARAARFNNELPGNRYKELEALRNKQRKEFQEQGLINSGQTLLGDAVDFRGTCEGMCNEYEIEFREYTREINPFEALPNGRMDHAKAVAAYTRSDAGAGHGEAAKLPSDLRTPAALVRSLDYLITTVMALQPRPNPNAVHQPPPTQRRALGNSAGFIRDRTRAIRKEFAMQSSWGHEEAIASYERIARWHILCLRELQEETGSNADMHIDSAELGRCFVSLRQHYNDRREELGIDLPCPNEPEFRAYMLIFDLANKSVSIPTAELPAVIMDHPLVQLAWQIRQVAQRNFDSQKEGSKLNSEYGANLITRFVRLLKNPKMPYLLSCLVEVRLREMRRSALRALTRAYPRLDGEPVRLNEQGAIIERKMVLMPTLDRLLGAEEQETEPPAWDDAEPVSTNPDDEAAAVVKRFGIAVYPENGPAVGALINPKAPYNDNKDAPFTRRWKLISDKLGSATYAEVINGEAGVSVDGAAAQPVKPGVLRPAAPVFRPTPAAPVVKPAVPAASEFSPAPAAGGSAFGPAGGASAFGPAGGTSAFGPAKPTSAFGSSTSAFGPTASSSAFGPPKGTAASGPTASAPAAAGAFANGGPPQSGSAFSFGKPSAAPTPTSSTGLPTASVEPKSATSTTTTPLPTPAEPSAPTRAPIPNFFGSKDTTPATPAPKPPTQPPSFFSTTPAPAPVSTTPTSIPNFFSNATKPPEAGPSKLATVPFSFDIPAAQPPPLAPAIRAPSPAPAHPATPPKPKIPRITMSYMDARLAGPTLRDRLIREVLQEIVDDSKPYFETLVAAEQDAIDREAEEEARRERIERDAELAFQRMIDDEVKILCWAEALQERKSRARMRETFDYWREWAQTAAEKRRQDALLREAELRRREKLPLRPLTFSYGPGASRSARSTRSFSHASAVQYPSEAEMNAHLQQAQHSAEELWRPGTFLRVIMDHIAPLIGRSNELRQSSSAPMWETVLLTAEHSATPASEASRGWLRDKLSPSSGRVASHRGVDFYFTSTDVHGEFPGSSDAGLFVFEAPRDMALSQGHVEQNAEDASDRLQAAASSAQQRGRYRSALLLVSWENETQEELIGRLGIDADVQLFDSVATVSMEYPDALEDLLRGALAQLVPSDPCKTRVVIPLDDLVSHLEEEWQRIVYMAGILSKEHGDSVPLATAALSAAVNILSALPGVIDDAVDPEPISTEATYDPPGLPPLHLTANDLPTAAEQITTYLSSAPLNGVQSIALASSALQHTAAQSHSLPIVPVLVALGSYVLGTIRSQTLPLDMWLPPPEPEEASHTILSRITTSFHDVVNREIRTFSRAARDAKEAADALVASATPLPPSPPPAAKKGTKRRLLEDDSESKKKRAARRLRKLLAYHDKAFGESEPDTAAKHHQLV